LLYLLIKDLTTTSRHFQLDVKIKELITIIIASLFPNSRLVLAKYVRSYDIPKIRNLPSIFLSFEIVGPGS